MSQVHQQRQSERGSHLTDCNFNERMLFMDIY